jgi:hypothetical protein
MVVPWHLVSYSGSGINSIEVDSDLKQVVHAYGKHRKHEAVNVDHCVDSFHALHQFLHKLHADVEHKCNDST